ncbi:MAG: FAD-dependent oxidoreductase [Cyanobacteria bacterium QS_8_64_29]|nr:MAG: FAD-dependent oxidoreductase [Cyanobacteria bacterium QS_8_64_29]
MRTTEAILSQLPGDILGGLRRTDRQWQALREGTLAVPQPISERQTRLGQHDCDVAVAGGTLGILVAAALQQRGWQVAVLERGLLRGREQEWNISREEVQALVELGLLEPSELEAAIATEYNPARVTFRGGPELWVENVLNIGIDPVVLIATLKRKFVATGGWLLENAPFGGATIHPDGACVEAGGQQLNARLLVDAMGHFSPIARQARNGAKPDGACVVVGGCARGFPNNATGDLLASFTPLQNQCQYFWEAFPAKDGRTTYLFSYLDAHPQRPSLEFFLDEYFRLLPQYQQVALEQLQFQRVLFGVFPAYRQSPLRVPWDRVLPVGDSSGMQSPLSFGGFGAAIRHLKRLSCGIDEALQADALGQRDLALLQPYQPNIAVTWLFQRAMRAGIDQQLPPDRVNALLNGVFGAMAELGEDVLRPFLQDVIQFGALTQALARTTVTRPALIPPVVSQVGLQPLLAWLRDYANLGLYSSLSPLGRSLAPLAERLPPGQRYAYRRWLEAWQYGAGRDYGAT